MLFRSYKQFNDFSTAPGSLIDTFVVNELRNGSFVFVQPYVNMQLGTRFFRLNAQAGCQLDVHHPKSDVPLSSHHYDVGQGYEYYNGLVYVSLGFTFHYAPRFGRVSFRRENHEKDEHK